jgi:hypothetical protein
MSEKTPDATQDMNGPEVAFYRGGNEPLMMSEVFADTEDDTYQISLNRLIPSGYRAGVHRKDTGKTVCTAVLSENDMLMELIYRAVDMAKVFEAGPPEEQEQPAL